MKLKREIGFGHAIFLGLGSILGTGLFLSLALAAKITGGYMLFALLIAGFVALCNALNSAQLAANYPTSGGAYEYGYVLLNPTFGFVAGWNFLLAKSASAAASAIGFAYSIQTFVKLPIPLLALITVFIMTVFVAFGLKKSSMLNFIFVTLLLMPLILLLGFGFFSHFQNLPAFSFFEKLSDIPFSLQNFLKATALLFVAYTGYGRIATLGEEIENPRKNIPKSILVTLVITLILYLSVSYLSLVKLGTNELSQSLANQTVPLLVLAEKLEMTWLKTILTVAVSISFLSVLLNLLLGLSRVLLAMARRGDAPQFLKHLNKKQTSPVYAVFTVGALIGTLAFFLKFEKNWAMSAFSVLIYYGILNLSALKLEPSQRLYAKAFTVLGLMSCFFLAFWVDLKTWVTGIILIGCGLLFRFLFRKILR